MLLLGVAKKGAGHSCAVRDEDEARHGGHAPRGGCRRLEPPLPDNVKLHGAALARPNSNGGLCAASGDGGEMGTGQTG